RYRAVDRQAQERKNRHYRTPRGYDAKIAMAGRARVRTTSLRRHEPPAHISRTTTSQCHPAVTRAAVDRVARRTYGAGIRSPAHGRAPRCLAAWGFRLFTSARVSSPYRTLRTVAPGSRKQLAYEGRGSSPRARRLCD